VTAKELELELGVVQFFRGRVGVVARVVDMKLNVASQPAEPIGVVPDLPDGAGTVVLPSDQQHRRPDLVNVGDG
jgi:hypothetical protein